MRVSTTTRVASAFAVGLIGLGSMAACGAKSTPLGSPTKTPGGNGAAATTTTVAGRSTTSATAETSTTIGGTATSTSTDGATSTTLAENTGAPQTFPSTNWNSGAARYRQKKGTLVRYACPPNGTIGSVWGSDPYTDDSSVCSAAVHAGLITAATGGTVVIEITGPKDSFVGSAKNGVTSSDYGQWDGSFTFPDKDAG